jgi:thymidylate synthase
MEKKNNLDSQYTKLLEDILENGTKKQTRNGETISVFGRQIRHQMSEGFPLLTTKRMPFKTIVTELLWFLRGDTNIKYLVDNNCHIWDGDAYKNYINNPAYKAESVADLMSSQAGQLVECSTQEEFINKIKTDDEFAAKWGELGPIYGKQWRSWEGFRHGWHDVAKVIDGSIEPHIDWLNGIDQIQNLINELKTNPDSRRLMVNAWNVGELDQMVLPPCHYGFQVYTRELSLKEQVEAYNNMLQKQNYNPKWQSKINDIDKLSDGELMTILQSLPGPTRAISLMWNQRSVDTFLGLPFNIASYGLLLEIIAKKVNMVPDQLIGNLGDVHLYSNHIEQAKEQIGRELTHDEKVEYARSLYGKEEWWNINDKRVITVLQKKKQTREPYPLPKLVFNPIFLANLEHNSFDQAINGQIDFELEGYQSHPTIKAPLSN